VAKVVGAAKWNHGPVPTRPKDRGFMSGPGNNPAKTTRVGFLAISGTEPNRTEPPVKMRTASGLPGPVAYTKHDQYVDCVVLAHHSPPALTFAIGPIFVESLSKTRTFQPEYHLLSQ
jgi:hypothetical protein